MGRSHIGRRLRLYLSSHHERLFNQPGGIRQRESTDGYLFTDRFLVTDGGPITASIDKGVSTSVSYNELGCSGDRQAGGSHQDGKLSDLFSRGSYLESYGGGTNGATGGFDGLTASSGRPFMAALLRFGSRSGNNPYSTGSFGNSGMSKSGIGGWPIGSWNWGKHPTPFKPVYRSSGFENDPPNECPDCCKWLSLGIPIPSDPSKYSTETNYNILDSWCHMCCGTKVLFGACTDSKNGRVWAVGECWLRCCHNNPPSGSFDSLSLLKFVTDECMDWGRDDWINLLEH